MLWSHHAKEEVRIVDWLPEKRRRWELRRQYWVVGGNGPGREWGGLETRVRNPKNGLLRKARKKGGNTSLTTGVTAPFAEEEYRKREVKSSLIGESLGRGRVLEAPRKRFFSLPPTEGYLWKRIFFLRVFVS